MYRKKVVEIWFVCLFFLLSTTSTVLTCDCTPWLAGGIYAGGYCVDHIQDKMTAAGLGSRPTGDAGTWAGNIEKTEVQIRDVAIFNSGAYGHVGWTEEIVSRDSNGKPKEIRISEKNYGSSTGDPIKDCCGVTKMYNVVSERIINVSDADRFWRPTGAPIPTLPYRVVGNVAWYPPDSSCFYAERWIYFSGGFPDGGQSVGTNQVCQDHEQELIDALGGIFSNWMAIVYGYGSLNDITECKLPY